MLQTQASKAAKRYAILFLTVTHTLSPPQYSDTHIWLQYGVIHN